MTDFESTLIDSTKDLMNDLMKNLSSIESVEIVKEFVSQGEVVILLPDGAVKKLAVIPEEGLGIIKQHIIQQLDYELSESLTKLKYLTDAHSSYRFEPVETEEAAVEEPEQEEEPKKKHGNNSKADKLDIEEMRRLKADGWSTAQLARRYKISSTTVRNYLKEKRSAS